MSTKRKTLGELKKILEQHKEELRKKYNVKEIGIFGSVVRGEQRKGSDVDIIVEFENIPDLFKFLELERHLEALLNRRVDLVRKKALREELKSTILSEVMYV